MKNLFLIAFLFIIGRAESQVYQSSCSPLDTITNFYLDDAAKLNFRYIHRVGNTYKDSIRLNTAITTSFYKALLAVYNATTMPARDTVVRLLKIHTFNPYLHQFLIEADSNLQWVQNYKNNVFPTGYNTIDSLMSKHNLHKWVYFNLGLHPYAELILKADTSLNMVPLKNFVSALPGIHGAYYDDWVAGDSPDIQDSVTANYHWLVYQYGWGDCENGCFFHRYWQFRIYNDCSVEYGGSYGSEMIVGVKLNGELLNETRVFPNPVNDMLNIEGLTKTSTITLVNMLGQTIVENKYEAGPVTIDFNSHSKGIYFLKIREGGEERIMKVLKE